MQSIDWQKIAPEVARELLGEPKTTTSTEYRWGSKGSLVLNLNDATWYDFENDTGGGIVDLIKHLNQDVKGNDGLSDLVDKQVNDSNDLLTDDDIPF